jgi:chaperonin GroES
MITPLGNNVTAQLTEATKVTKSGLYLGDAATQALAPKVATILAVGDDVTKIKVGQEVVFKPYATYEVKENGTDYVMLEEEDILGIIETK